MDREASRRRMVSCTDYMDDTLPGLNQGSLAVSMLTWYGHILSRRGTVRMYPILRSSLGRHDRTGCPTGSPIGFLGCIHRPRCWLAATKPKDLDSGLHESKAFYGLQLGPLSQSRSSIGNCMGLHARPWRRSRSPGSLSAVAFKTAEDCVTGSLGSLDMLPISTMPQKRE